jgi:predicted transposase YdaD
VRHIESARHAFPRRSPTLPKSRLPHDYHLPQPVNRPHGRIWNAQAALIVRPILYDGIMTSTPPTPPSDARSNANPDTPLDAAGAEARDESPSQPQPHDGFFKRIFSDPVHAAAELRAILPDLVSRHIDWDSLQAVHASFVDAALHQRHGDLMFSARLVEGHEVYLWLLFEHQRTVDRWMPLRMLEMVVEFLKGWRKEHPEALSLPAILPIVLYQGATPWTAPRTLAELYDLSDQALRDLGELLLSLRFVLDDLRVTPDDALLERRVTDLARVALVVMKHVTSEHLLDQLVRLRDEVSRLLGTEEGCIGLSGILWYIESVHPKLKQRDIISHLGPVVGPEFANTMETYEETLRRMWIEKHERLARDEGRNEGRKEGRREGLQELLLQQLAWRFGELPQAITERVNRATSDELDHWGKRILGAASLDDVFTSS